MSAELDLYYLVLENLHLSLVLVSDIQWKYEQDNEAGPCCWLMLKKTFSDAGDTSGFALLEWEIATAQKEFEISWSQLGLIEKVSRLPRRALISEATDYADLCLQHPLHSTSPCSTSLHLTLLHSSSPHSTSLPVISRLALPTFALLTIAHPMMEVTQNSKQENCTI
jgi:hypothetical protein